MKKNMKRTLVLVATGLMVIGSAVTSLAGTRTDGVKGEWKKDHIGWWWQNEDGSWPSASWQWLDGNGDGVAECYYFNAGGYMLSATTTPDGYQVNADGAWMEGGKVQTQSVKHHEIQKPTEEKPAAPEIPEKAEMITGFNENGVSNLAISLLFSTMEENDRKYGITGESEAGISRSVGYDCGYSVSYRYGEPEKVTATPSMMIKGAKDGLKDANQIVKHVKDLGFEDAYTDGVMVVLGHPDHCLQWNKYANKVHLSKYSGQK